jgi:hypothetical protein
MAEGTKTRETCTRWQWAELRSGERAGAILAMARERAREIPSLVMDILRAVHEKTKDKQQPYYVGFDALGIEADTERNGAAIVLAALSGWITVTDRPTHSVAITAAGIELLKERGFV